MSKAAASSLLEGHVDGSVIRLASGTRLSKGMRVGIIPLDPLKTDSPFLKTMLKLAAKREDSRKRSRKSRA